MTGTSTTSRKPTLKTAVTPSPALQYINDVIRRFKIVIFTKPGCLLCASILQMFTSMNVSYKMVEVEKNEQGEVVLAELMKKTRYKLMPKVFVNGKWIGNIMQIKRLHESGKLYDMINTFANYRRD